MKIALLVTFILAAAVVAGGCKQSGFPEPQANPPAAIEPATDLPTSEGQSASRYVPFAPEVLASTATQRRVLYFYANWCPTCRPANQDFLSNADQIPEDVVVIRVNYNDSDTDAAEKALAQQYGITYQHTFVQIDSQGKALKTWNGGQVQELITNVQ